MTLFLFIIFYQLIDAIEVQYYSIETSGCVKNDTNINISLSNTLKS